MYEYFYYLIRTASSGHFKKRGTLKSSSKRSILGGSNKSRRKLLKKSSSNSGKSVSKRQLSKSKTHHAKRSPSNGSSKSKRDLLKSKSHPGKLPERSTSAINTKMTFMSNFSLSIKKKKKNGIPNAVKKQMASRAAAKTNRMKKNRNALNIVECYIESNENHQK